MSDQAPDPPSASPAPVSPASASAVSAEARLGDAIADYVERQRTGSEPDLEEFLRGYPDIAGVLRSCLAILAALPTSAAREDGERELPAQLGDFRLIRVLGRGGMGVVYEAEQKSLKRRVALKVLPPLGAGDPERVERFRREIEVTARLQHPNIVPVFEHGRAAGLPFYAMPLLAGEGLDHVLRGMRADPTAAPLERRGDLALWVRRFADVGRALHAAHAAGVIHRDVKPSNLFLETGGRLLVLDFGLTRTSGDASLTASHGPVGTPRYMSPEQILAQRMIDGRADVFSLAATMYELFTLRAAFTGDDRETVFRAILSEDPPAPRKLDPRVPRDLEVVLMKALEKEPERRYASALELADDLERFLDYEPLRAKPVGALGRLARRARRNPVAAWSLVAGGLGLVGSAVFPTWQVLARERSVADLVGRAELDLAGGDPETARDLALQALAHAPEHSGARGLERAAAAALRERSESERRAEAERAARTELEAARAARAERSALDERMDEIRSELEAARGKSRPWQPLAVKGDEFDAEEDHRTTRRAREAATRAVFSHLLTALQLRPGDAEARRELARFAFDEFVAAEKRRDRETMQALRPLIETYDDGALAVEWEGAGSLVLASEPDGAEVFLFRYEDQDHLRIAIPCSADGAPDRSFLASASTRGPWVYVLITGEVPCLADEALLPGDRLITVCGDPAASPWILRDHWCSTPPHRFEVLREGRYEVIRLAADDPAARAELPGDVVRHAAFDLRCDERNHIGATPLGPLRLPMGSYLALLRVPGFPDVRLPFAIGRREDEVARVRFYTTEEIGEGFVLVPAGPAILGGDAGARGSHPLEERTLRDFFVRRTEVTFGEYLEFVRAREGRDPVGARALLPRAGARGDPLVELTDGEPELRDVSIALDQPVFGITFRDAQAYARWLTEREDDPAVDYALPTQSEWEKAARGADGRTFPWGDGFDPTLARTGLSAWLTDTVPGGLYPTDESVYGVLDLTGNVREYCERDSPAKIPFEILRGGSYYDRLEGDCHPANVSNTLEPEEREYPPRTGFRIVKRRTR